MKFFRIPQVDIAFTLQDQRSKIKKTKPELFETCVKIKFCLNDSNCNNVVSIKKEIEKEIKNEVDTIENIIHQNNKILFLSSNLNNPLSSIKNSMFFMCSEVFKRNNFGKHFKVYHTQMQAWSDHWIDHRCPLSTHGCTYSQPRLKPKDHSLTFDTQYFQFRACPDLYFSVPFDSVYFSKKNDANISYMNNPHTEVKSVFHFLLLPDLILEHILSYLQSSDLRNVSLVCNKLRNMCKRLLEKEGIVELKWEKVLRNGSFCWYNTSYVSWLHISN